MRPTCWWSTTTADFATSSTSYLGLNGYRVTAVASAAEARARLESLAFEIIVLDVMMPGENGFDFAERLRETSDIPILMLTALGEASDRVRGLEAGVDDYLAKPYEPKELLLRVASILRRTRNPAPLASSDEPGVRFGPFLFFAERGELRRGDTSRQADRARARNPAAAQRDAGDERFARGVGGRRGRRAGAHD